MIYFYMEKIEKRVLVVINVFI